MTEGQEDFIAQFYYRTAEEGGIAVPAYLGYRPGIKKAFATDRLEKELDLVYFIQQPASPNAFDGVQTNTAWKQKPLGVWLLSRMMLSIQI